MSDIVDAEIIADPELVSNIAALALREPSALVRPVGDLDSIDDAFHEYQALCNRLLDDSDYQQIRDKRFRKRSAWRKLAVAFGVTFEIVDRVHQRDSRGRIVSSEFIVRATAPNGRFADGWGACTRWERCCPPKCYKKHDHCVADCEGSFHFSHAEHDIPATAETRAKNRAAADLFGMGEVSAEEITDRGEDRPPSARPQVVERPRSEYVERARADVSVQSEDRATGEYLARTGAIKRAIGKLDSTAREAFKVFCANNRIPAAVTQMSEVQLGDVEGFLVAYDDSPSTGDSIRDTLPL